jgi:hypothetical protein
MRFWYIIPNLLRDLVTIMLEQVQGFPASFRKPQGQGYPQSTYYFMRDEQQKDSFEIIFQNSADAGLFFERTVGFGANRIKYGKQQFRVV